MELIFDWRPCILGTSQYLFSVSTRDCAWNPLGLIVKNTARGCLTTEHFGPINPYGENMSRGVINRCYYMVIIWYV